MTLNLCSDHMRSKANLQSFNPLPGRDDGDGDEPSQALPLLRVFVTCTFCVADMNDPSKVLLIGAMCY